MSDDLLVFSADGAAGSGSGGPQTDTGAAEPEEQIDGAGGSEDAGSGPGEDHS